MWLEKLIDLSYLFIKFVLLWMGLVTWVAIIGAGIMKFFDIFFGRGK